MSRSLELGAEPALTPRHADVGDKHPKQPLGRRTRRLPLLEAHTTYTQPLPSCAPERALQGLRSSREASFTRSHSHPAPGPLSISRGAVSVFYLRPFRPSHLPEDPTALACNPCQSRGVPEDRNRGRAYSVRQVVGHSHRLGTGRPRTSEAAATGQAVLLFIPLTQRNHLKKLKSRLQRPCRLRVIFRIHPIVLCHVFAIGPPKVGGKKSSLILSQVCRRTSVSCICHTCRRASRAVSFMETAHQRTMESLLGPG